VTQGLTLAALEPGDPLAVIAALPPESEVNWDAASTNGFDALHETASAAADIAALYRRFDRRVLDSDRPRMVEIFGP
jgi:hypothetical protein